ncbi:MAG TPA: sigma-E factor regulatory protein RseB domain-containing protein [Jiangellaceae bacterium]|nr:sigma-E factor regulatory protein RseB domain-containing protein [Jiangellaceae bacterium]
MIGPSTVRRRGSGPLSALGVPALAVPVLVGAIAVAPPAVAEDGDDLAAVDLLHRAMSAPDTVSYTGTQFVAAWSALGGESTSAVVDVVHRAGGTTEVRVHGPRPMSALDGHSGATWLADGGGPVDLLVRAYDVVLVGVGTVAGRAARVVEARRPDGSAAARLWLDSEFALPLRREIYAEDGATRAASAFVELRFHPAGPQPPPRRGSDGVTTASLRHGELARMRDNGWSCPDQLEGGLVLYEARWVDDAVQLSYSDGVVTVSVFEQEGRLDPRRLYGYAAREVDGGVVYSSPGPPATFTWSAGDWVVTVVADAPAETIDAVLAAMPPKEPDDQGLLGRIGTGALRIASWFNPFD